MARDNTKYDNTGLKTKYPKNQEIMYNLRANYCNSTPAVIYGTAEDKRVISHLFMPSTKLLLLHKSVEKLLLPWWDRIKSPVHVQQAAPREKFKPTGTNGNENICLSMLWTGADFISLKDFLKHGLSDQIVEVSDQAISNAESKILSSSKNTLELVFSDKAHSWQTNFLFFPLMLIFQCAQMTYLLSLSFTLHFTRFPLKD